MKNKFMSALWILLGLWLLASVMAFFVSFDTGFGSGSYSETSGLGANINVGDANVLVIPITGLISIQSSSGLLDRQSITSSDSVAKAIDYADNNPNIKAIIFEINSPGGYPVATDEIAEKIKSTEKPTVALIREIGTSGAYWVASSCDHVIANRMSMTGSIGVFGSYLEVSDLLERYNVTYQRLVAGEYKDMGSPYKKMTDKELKLYQKTLDTLHDFFIKAVSENRNLSIAETRKIATGNVYLGVEAKELGLVDELGSKEAAVQHLTEVLGTEVKLSEYRQKKSFFDELISGFSGFTDAKITKYINSEKGTPTISFS
ncbi:MAG: signal peptide peptidase SppA [Nanoarchaeota archaeon]|nr:signal peptide peptidase SppA [Nanoarchaeota archaeon]